MPPQIDLDPKQQERMKALMVDEIRRGASISLTAKRYKVPLKVVRAACRDYGLSTPHREGGERVYWVIAALLSTDRRLTDIAEEQGVSKVYIDRIYQRCKTAGIPVRERPRGRPSKAPEEERD